MPARGMALTRSRAATLLRRNDSSSNPSTLLSAGCYTMKCSVLRLLYYLSGRQSVEGACTMATTISRPHFAGLFGGGGGTEKMNALIKQCGYKSENLNVPNQPLSGGQEVDP
jgi:hypothetical protein